MLALRTLALGTILGFFLFGAVPAYSHNIVEILEPAPESTISESPLTMSLTTNDFFLKLGNSPSGFAMNITDSSGLHYGDGCVDLAERAISTVVPLGSADTYTVVYQFVSADGHSVSGSWQFRFEPQATHLPSEGFATPARCGVPRESESPPGDTPVAIATPISADITDTNHTTWGPLLLGGAAGLSSIAVVVWLIARQRRTPPS